MLESDRSFAKCRRSGVVWPDGGEEGLHPASNFELPGGCARTMDGLIPFAVATTISLRSRRHLGLFFSYKSIDTELILAVCDDRTE